MAAAKIEDALQIERYRKIMLFVVERFQLGRAALISDVTREFDYTPSSTHDFVRRLESQGLLRIEGERLRQRHLVPTEQGKARMGVGLQLRVQPLVPRAENTMQDLPIACGVLTETIAEPDYVEHPFQDFRKGDYLLTAEGDSMIDPNTGLGIHPGDKLHMRPDEWPINGQIVHAEYVRDNGVHECTLKVFEMDREARTVTLWALNPAYPDIVRDEQDILIQGVMLDQTTPAKRFTRK